MKKVGNSRKRVRAVAEPVRLDGATPSGGCPFRAAKSSGIAGRRLERCSPLTMSTKSRQTIWGGSIIGAKIRAEGARKRAAEAIREADRAEAEAWSVQMEGYVGPAQPSPTIGQCINGGLGWLEVECKRCKTRASLPLDAIRCPRNTPIWKLEAALKCRSCRTPRYSPPVRMIKLTEERELAPYVWVHPDEER